MQTQGGFGYLGTTEIKFIEAQRKEHLTIDAYSTLDTLAITCIMCGLHNWRNDVKKRSTLILSSTILAASLALGLGTASADQHDSPLYGGVGYGFTHLDDSDNNFNAITGFDDRDEAWSFFVGYKFSDNFAVEGGYSDLGDYDYDGGDLEVEAFTVDAVGILPVHERIDVFAKAGLARVKYDAEQSTHENALTFGVGADYDFGNNVSLQAEWTRIQEDEAPLDIFGANLVYGF